MKILIVGNGGREHAFAWKMSQSPLVSQIFVAPGNAGTALESRTANLAIAATDIDALINFALQQPIDLTVIGPEVPLSLGIVDKFTQAGLKCFGPTQASAQLESSKAFAKEFMRQYRIPTAEYAVFTEVAPALEYLKQQQYPVVIKADGLAAGKGVIIAHDVITAQTAITDMLADNVFGVAGSKLVIEEFLQGEEASFIVLTDGKTIIPCATSQDHKARNDGDTGPNTGGMGAYSPAPVINQTLHHKIMEQVIKPTIAGMAQRGYQYQGFLYAGIMITPQGEPKVLEYNCRCGDPETQPIMMRLQSDLIPLLLDTACGRLKPQTLQWDPRLALGVVLTASGYPESSSQGAEIKGLPNHLPENCKIFHAGTSMNDGEIVTNGGRVLTITTLANSIVEAQKIVYALADSISWNGGVHYRTDIGNRALAYCSS